MMSRLAKLLACSTVVLFLGCNRDAEVNASLLDAPAASGAQEGLRLLRSVTYDFRVEEGCVEGKFVPDGTTRRYAPNCNVSPEPSWFSSCELENGSEPECVSTGADGVIVEMVHEVDPEGRDPLSLGVLSACTQELDFDGCPGSGTDWNNCARFACNSVRQACAANRVLDLQQPRVGPEEIQSESTVCLGSDFCEEDNLRGTILLPPVAARDKLALSELAMGYSRESLDTTVFALALGCTVDPAYGTGDLEQPLSPTAGADLPPGLGGRTLGSVLATTWAEGLSLEDEAGQQVVQLLAQLGDSYAGVEPPDGVEVPSRRAAVEQLVGRTRQEDSDGEPWCSVRELSGGAKRALEVLRDVAISPAAIANLSTEDLLYGTVSDGNVAERLTSRHGLEHPVTSVPKMFGLELQHFAEAQAYLREELRVFRRDTQLLVDPDELNHPRYAAVAKAPVSPPAVLYVSDSEWTAEAEPARDMSGMADSQGLTVDSHRSLLFARDAQAELISRVLEEAPASDIAEPLELILRDLRHELRGRWRLQAQGTGDPEPPHRVTFVAQEDTLEPLVVIGDSGLRCAVMGDVEGLPCNLRTLTGAWDDAHVLAELSATGEPDGTHGLFPHTYQGEFVLGSRAPVPGTVAPVYLVLPKPGLSLQAASPGDFEAVGVLSYQTASNFDSWRPLNRSLTRQAGDLLVPSTRDCAGPKVLCNGKETDARLPLEDELTEDGDGLESSWKHYLNLAERMAAESDALASTFMNETLDVARREEELALREHASGLAVARELATLSSLCGTEIDESGLRDLLELCQNNDPECSLTDALRLEELSSPTNDFGACLADGSRQSAVAVGDRDLCYVRDPGQEFCQSEPVVLPDGDEQKFQCPKPAKDAEACPEGWLRTSGHLGFFPSPTTPPTDPSAGFAVSEMDKICNGLRNQRTALTPPNLGELLLDKRAGRYMFHQDNLETLVADLAYVDEPGNFGNLILKEKVWKSTGNYIGDDEFSGSWLRTQQAFPGSANYDFRDAEWPLLGVDGRGCGYESMDVDEWRLAASHAKSLFCSIVPVDQPSRDARIEFNTRLRKAVFFLKWLTIDTDYIEEGGDRIRVYRNLTVAIDTRRTDPVVGWGKGGSVGTLYPFEPDKGQAPLEWWSKQTTEYGLRTWYRVTGSALPSLWHSENSQVGSRAVLFRSPRVLYGTSSRYRGFYERLPSKYQRDIDPYLNTGRVGTSNTSKMWPTMRATGGNELLFGGEHPGKFEEEKGPSQLGRLKEFTTSVAHDAIELVCEANAELVRRGEEAGDMDSCGGDSDSPEGVDVTSEVDLGAVAARLECMASNVLASGRNTLLWGFPAAAADALRQESAVGVFPKQGGQLGATVADIRATLIEFQNVAPQVASQITLLKNDVLELQSLLRRSELKQEINQLHFWKETTREISGCVGATARVASWGGGVAAAATCINSAIQIGLSAKISELDAQLGEEDKLLAITDFRKNFEARAQAMRELSTGIGTMRERIDGALIRYDELRIAARQTIDRVDQLFSQPAEQQERVNDLHHRRFSHTARRFKRAFEGARDMAFLAARSIETRLGESLANMTEDLPLVEAPAKWFWDVCRVDEYEREPEPAPRQPRPIIGPQRFDFGSTSGSSVFAQWSAPRSSLEDRRDLFVGEYVAKLRAVIESYRLEHSFHEGDDIAVISLRDDIMGTRASCKEESANLVSSSAALNQWEVSGCSSTENCTGVSRLDSGPLRPGESKDTQAPGMTVTFGPAPPVSDLVVAPACGAGIDCGLTAQTQISRAVSLVPGEQYVLSWYARPSGGGGPAVDGSSSVIVRSADADPLMPTAVGQPQPCEDGWLRYSQLIEIPLASSLAADAGVAADGEYMVAVVPVDLPGGGLTQQVDIAAVQVEVATQQRDDDPLGLGVDPPRPFELTNSEGLTADGRCEDSDGAVFRRTAWQRGCIRQCPSGFTGDCAVVDSVERCYQEASFYIDQARIDRGELLKTSGFAYGNFNYRLDTLALNFVGTNVRDCSDAELPQTCYAGGYVPYSLLHTGPFHVTNVSGESYQTLLFDGRIEYARGLATERYVTNPLSDADRGLLQDYQRLELQGRPLDGNFSLRVWEDEGFDFSSIQDVQLVLKYHYWTRGQ